MARLAGIAFGVFTHVLFAVTVWYLFWFLKDGPPISDRGALEWDAALAFQFAVVHSILLLPRVRKRLVPWIRSEFYGCFFCVATCATLLLTIAPWRASPVVLWECHGWLLRAVQAGFYASWVALVYSLALTGLGYQTGLTPWLHWLRGERPPRRGFQPRGAYRYLRHPVYLSFLGLVWFTPRMTLDHAVLTAIWTAYLLVGSVLKDRRLVHYLGDAYRRYQARVSGYPLVPFGPLARIPWQDPDTATQAAAAVPPQRTAA
ncbi:MAG: hypothetical protein HUU20_25110 [Pirellulales bacterium]|nr:hypothetical protein [Pirellulales bacterium]